MKKIIFAVATFLLLSAAASAQLSYGLKGGMNLTTLTQVRHTDAEFKPSFYIGGFAEYRFNDFLAISPELVYSRQGYKYSISNAYVDSGDGQYRLNYINIPVLAKIYVIGERLSLDLGPQFGFLATAKLKLDYEMGGESGDRTIDVKDDVPTFDCSFAAGLTYNFGKVFVQGRYNLGLTETVINDRGKKCKNSVFQIGAGYRF